MGKEFHGNNCHNKLIRSVVIIRHSTEDHDKHMPHFPEKIGSVLEAAMQGGR